MADYTEVFQLLSAKIDLFLQFEKAAEAMYASQAEEIISNMDTRSKLLEKVSSIDIQIKQCSDKDSILKMALNHSCTKKDLPKELAIIFDASLAVKAVVNRITKNEDTIKKNIEFEKARLLEKVKKLNSSGQAVAGSYHRTLQGAVGNRPSRLKGKLI